MADLLHMLIVAMLFNTFLFAGSEVQLLFQLVITGLIMVVMVRGGGWLVLGAMQVSMFFYESRASMATIELPTIASGILCLGLWLMRRAFGRLGVYCASGRDVCCTHFWFIPRPMASAAY